MLFLQKPIFLLSVLLLLSGCDQPNNASDTSAKEAEKKTDKSQKSHGEVIYNRWCVSCHLVGVSGAPRLAAPEDWKDRLPQGRDQLITSVIQGMAAMPPRGLCRTCSDEELAQSVDYMLGTLPNATSQ